MNRDRILIEADELLTRLDDPNIRIYDATILFFRSESEKTAYETYLAGHIPGAAFFDHQAFSDPSSSYMYTILPEAELCTQLGNVGISADSEVIFYTTDLLPCATRAWWILYYAGHDNVRILNGGLAAWEKAGGKVEQGARQYEPTTFDCRLRSDAFANMADVQAVLEDDRVSKEYTLPTMMYGGAQIPGSSCILASDLMHEMTSFLPETELESRLKGYSQYDRIITYCGGGIAATLNAVAYLIIGNENVAVYDGSLTEWMGEGQPITKIGKVD